MASIFMLILSILCSQGLYSSSVAATSTIRVGDQLNSTTKLVSENGNFALGFFTVGRPNSQNSSYFGVWYTNDNQQRKVWVANPNRPINNTSFGVLTIDSTGTLKITSAGNTILSLYDHNGTVNAMATLEDSGNFVLMDAADRRTLWQSFDHPTNTLLAGMKLGYNLTSRQNWTLTSWLDDYVPAAGAFDLSLESIDGSAQLAIYRRGDLYWRSGPWNNGNFEFTVALNDTRNPYQHNLNYVSNGDGKYFTFDATDANISMLALTSKGEILDGANSRFVSPAGFSLVIDWLADNGWVNTVLPRCRSQNGIFQEKSAYFLGTSYVDNTISSLSDCMERCWNDCSCVGFANNSNGTSCIMWSGNDKYQIDESGNAAKKYVLVSSMLVSSMPPVSSVPPVSSMPPVSSKSSKGNKWIWAVIAIAIFLSLLTLGSLFYLRMRKRRIEGEEEKRRKKFLMALTASDNLNNADAFENNGREGHDLNIFSFASIAAATNNFSHQNKLGEGGFGPVYKGQLPEGREIAVKRLSRTSGQGLVEFKNELILITKLQHTNLVRVLGCCLHGEEKMLIYEYMANKSLDFFLFDSAKRELLNWEIRINIIDGVAQGLLYLHKYSRMRVIHRDLKASNILLDENMNPKISDFGMARIFNPNEKEAMTNRVVGTYGYMSPEYAMEGTFSVKSDVFSFGVLLLEIVSGRRNTTFYHLDRPLNLIGYAWELWKEGAALELKDPIVGDSCTEHEVLRTIHVGLLCVQESAMDRPTMSEVISLLGNETMPSVAPKQPAFFTGKNVVNSASHECSVNGLSISITEAR